MAARESLPPKELGTLMLELRARVAHLCPGDALAVMLCNFVRMAQDVGIPRAIATRVFDRIWSEGEEQRAGSN